MSFIISTEEVNMKHSDESLNRKKEISDVEFDMKNEDHWLEKNYLEKCSVISLQYLNESWTLGP